MHHEILSDTQSFSSAQQIERLTLQAGAAMRLLWNVSRRRMAYCLATACLLWVLIVSKSQHIGAETILKGPVRSDSQRASKPLLQLKDVAFLLRTGWEVRDRLEGPLSTWMKGLDKEQVAIYSDSDSSMQGYELQDFYKLLPMYERDEYQSLPQFEYYQDIHSQDNDDPGSPGLEPSTRNDGWKLDAIKQVASVYLGYLKLSAKHDYKFYVLVDDDTYVHLPSLLQVLRLADDGQPMLLGQYWGEQGGFMLGGAGVIMTRAALSQLIDDKPGIATEMLEQSPFSEIGDLHVANYMKKAGVKLNTTFSGAFWHERLEKRYNMFDRYCAPIATVHHQSPETMRQTHAYLGANTTEPVYMKDLLVHHPSSIDGSMWFGEYESHIECFENSNFQHYCQFISLSVAEDEDNARECQLICESDAYSQDCASWLYRPYDRMCCLAAGFKTARYPLANWELVGWSGVNRKSLSKWDEECGKTIWGRRV